MVQRFLPSLHMELERCSVPLNLIAIDHFISLTSRTWPLEATVRLWDIIFLEGPRAVFACFLALLQLFMPVSEGNVGEVSGSAMPGDDMSAFEIMELFKRQSTHGVTYQ